MPEEATGIRSGGGEILSDPTPLTTQGLLREVANLKEIIFTRFEAYDKAILLLQEYANRVPTIGEVVAKTDERFQAAKEVLAEIDKRYNAEFVKISTTSEMMVGQQALALAATKDAVAIAMSASEKAVAAALTAAKEAVKLQQDSNDKAIQKQEAVFTKQIDQIGGQIGTLTKSFDDKIDDLKNRVIAVESGATGGANTWNWVVVIAAVALAAIFVIFKGSP